MFLEHILNIFVNEVEKNQSPHQMKQIEKIINKIEKFPRHHDDNPYFIVHVMNDSPYNKDKLDMFEKMKPNQNFHHVFFVSGYEYINFNQYKNIDVFLIEYQKINDELFFSEMMTHLLENANVIFFQYLSILYIKLIHDMNIKGLLVWMPWGGDFRFYQNLEYYHQFDIDILKKMNIAVNKNELNHSVDIYYLQLFLSKIDVIFCSKEIYSFLNINHEIDHVIHFEYFFDPNPDILSYSDLEYLVKDQIKLNQKFKKIIENPSKIKIILGNSSTITNNHFSAIEQIKKWKNEGLDIFVTIMLSYGSEQYKKIIKKYAEDHLQNNYYIQEDFLDKFDFIYFSNLHNLAYMNHYRGQAFGAISIYLMLGLTVLVNKINPIYQDFKHDIFEQKELLLKMYDPNEIDLSTLKLTNDMSKLVFDHIKKKMKISSQRYSLFNGFLDEQ